MSRGLALALVGGVLLNVVFVACAVFSDVAVPRGCNPRSCEAPYVCEEGACVPLDGLRGPRDAGL